MAPRAIKTSRFGPRIVRSWGRKFVARLHCVYGIASECRTIESHATKLDVRQAIETLVDARHLVGPNAS